MIHNKKIVARILETIQQLKQEYQNTVIPIRETLAHPYNQLANDGIRTVDYLITSWRKRTLLSMNIQ